MKTIHSKIIFLIIIIIGIFFNACGDTRSKIRSGHPYIHHIKNNGYTPQKGDWVEYHVTQRKGKKILYSSMNANSLKKIKIPEIDPKVDKYNRISPMTEALMLMSAGDSLTLEILRDSLPDQMAENAGVENMELDLKVISVTSKADVKKKEDDLVITGNELAAQLKKNIIKFKSGQLQGIKKNEAGLQYVFHEKGNGKQLKKDDIVFINYISQLVSNGKQILNSYESRHPFQLKIGDGKVIPGWEEFLPTLTIGDKVTLIVPYEKAYGAAGSKGIGVPEKADLAFYIHVESLK